MLISESAHPNPASCVHGTPSPGPRSGPSLPPLWGLLCMGHSTVTLFCSSLTGRFLLGCSVTFYLKSSTSRGHPVNTRNILLTARFVAKCENNTYCTYFKKCFFFSFNCPISIQKQKRNHSFRIYFEDRHSCCFLLGLGCLGGRAPPGRTDGGRVEKWVTPSPVTVE